MSLWIDGTVATPKQIRELMKVDGLTNDEVKSHLQVGLNFSLIYLAFFSSSSELQSKTNARILFSFGCAHV